MPELPEVQTVVSTLAPRLVGQTVRRVELSRTDILSPSGFDLSAHLVRQAISAIERRGKRIVFTLANGSRFYIHLGMSGRLTLDPADAPVPPHTHLRLAFDRGVEMRFRDPRRFGGIWWLRDGEDPGGAMGPEPLTLRSQELANRLARTARAIKNAMLDQTLVAGLGNIYVDESLFESNIHPLTPANKLTREQVERLNRAIKSTLRRAIRHRGSTLRDYLDAEGRTGGFQKLHRVYGRENEPCARCRASIQRIVLGGRSTHFCPRCQRQRKT